MDQLLDQPAAILVIITLAALLFVVEAALPTMGVAGTLALVLGVAAVVGVEQQDATWWPLVGPAGAIVLWCVMVARRSRTPGGQALAATLFGAGSVAFGAYEDSAVTAVVGMLAAVGLAAAFPHLHGAARRLLERPTQVGMDSLVGAEGTVVGWAGTTGNVRLQGSLWNAHAAEPLAIGDVVTVVTFSGMTLEVARADRNVKETTWKQ